MYYVKKGNTKLKIKLFKDGFKTYEQARQALRKMIRSLGHDSDAGYTKLGYSIIKA